MPIYRVTVDGRGYTVEVPDPDGRPVRAIVDGYVYEVEPGASTETSPGGPTETSAGAAERQPARGAEVTEQGSEPGEAVAVSAPLPGTIVSISVAAGERVEYGQELCVLEAMKMNNPIRATHAGRVTEVLIGVGQQVQHGQTLLVMVEG